MARNRDPFTLALSSLRDRIQSGVLAGGSPVIVQDEARRLALSTTPVREALARLSGEGLVERAPSGGYVTLRLDATSTRDRYAMNGQYIRFAFELTHSALGGLHPPAPSRHPDVDHSVEGLFAMIVYSAGNRVLWEAYQKVSGELETLRAHEALLFLDALAETDNLYAAYDSRDSCRILAALDGYHARRIAAAGALTALTFGVRQNVLGRDAADGTPNSVPITQRSGSPS